MEITRIDCIECQQGPQTTVCVQCGNSRFALIVDGKEQLVWCTPVTPALFQKWKIVRFLRTSHTMMVVVGIIIGVLLSGYAWYRSTLGEIALTMDPLWYLGLGLALCFVHVLVYRAKTLHQWNLSLPKIPSSDVTHTLVRDVSEYLDPTTWDVLESALTIAIKQDSKAIYPVHLFMACLASTQGGLVLARLGLTIEQLKPFLMNWLGQLTVAETSGTVLSVQTQELLLSTFLTARSNERSSIMSMDVLQTIVEKEPGVKSGLEASGVSAVAFDGVLHWLRLQEQLVEDHHAFKTLALLKPDSSMNRAMTARSTPVLDHFGEDMTRAARHDLLFPLIGRQAEMDQLLRLYESGQRAVCLLADPGVGKRAMIEGLAQRMVIEDVPPVLFDKRMVVVDIAQVLAGGDPQYAPQRVLEVIRESAMSGNILIVLEHIDALVKVSNNGLDLADILAGEIQQGHVLFLATTTPALWTSVVEPLALHTQFQTITLDEPPREAVMELLMAKTGSIEYKTSVYFTFGALEQAYAGAKRYLKEVRLPASALQLMTEAATSVQRGQGSGGFVTEEAIAKIIHEKTQIPVESLHSDEKQTLLALEGKLAKRVIGQKEAVMAVASAMRRARVDVREQRRPMATFLFLGPTGVGKTELAKALASEYIGHEKFLQRFDMSEYQLASSVSRLIGAPGDAKGGLLTEAVRKQPFSVVLLDELEKAHPDVLTLFLQVLDDARLTDGVGRTVDFTNTIVIATSNAGSRFIQDAVRDHMSYDDMKRALMEKELQQLYRPEFLNRFDSIVVFRPLQEEEIEQITWLQLHRITQQLEQKGYGFRAEDDAVRWLAQKGYDPQFGVRPLKRTIQDTVETAIADTLLRDELHRKDTLVLEEGGLLRIEPWKG